MYEFYSYQKCYVLGRDGQIEKDASGKFPRIVTIRSVDVSQMALWQSDMVFLPSGHAAATIVQRNWYDKKLIPCDQIELPDSFHKLEKEDGYAIMDELKEAASELFRELEVEKTIIGEMI